MGFEPIYDTTALFIYASCIAFIVLAPPLISAHIAAEKGRSISVWTLLYCFYSFIFLQPIYTFIDIEFTGLSKSAALILAYPVFALAPVWHSMKLTKTDSLQSAEYQHGQSYKSCVYCDALIESDHKICDSCHYRTSLSLIGDWRVLVFMVSVIVFLLSFFAAADEFVSDVHAYNMISPFLFFSQSILYAFATTSIALAIVCVIQLVAIWGLFYTIGTIFNTANCLTRGMKTRNPIILFYVSSYITVLHPILFSSHMGKSTEAIALEFSLGWWLWVFAYVLIILALHLLRDKNNNPNIQAAKYIHKS